MQIRVDNCTPVAKSYRAERVRSMFNATNDQATRFSLSADLPVDPDGDWQIGVIAGPSGSGKTSIGNLLWGGGYVYNPDGMWSATDPIVDEIARGVTGAFDNVVGSLSSAGLGDVPAWLRPYPVLSTGQRFRADLARILAERPERVVVDEFTSVVDRQIACVGAGAFAKTWRRGPGKVVLLTCHYDVLDWLEPDWVFDTATRRFHTNASREKEGESPWKRPRVDVDIRVGGWDLWPLFKPHHYLDSGPMPFGHCAVAFVDGEPVAHVGRSYKNVPVGGRTYVEARMSRLVVFPEWQGAGVGMRLLNTVAQASFEGRGTSGGRRMTTQFHTSHPGLCAALQRSPYWRRISGSLAGSNKKVSEESIARSALASGRSPATAGYGGHFRAVQGFRFYGGYEDPTEVRMDG